jgi:hypothetical protein
MISAVARTTSLNMAIPPVKKPLSGGLKIYISLFETDRFRNNRIIDESLFLLTGTAVSVP